MPSMVSVTPREPAIFPPDAREPTKAPGAIAPASASVNCMPARSSGALAVTAVRVFWCFQPAGKVNTKPNAGW